jgi:hypothetical protein
VRWALYGLKVVDQAVGRDAPPVAQKPDLIDGEVPLAVEDFGSARLRANSAARSPWVRPLISMKPRRNSAGLPILGVGQRPSS